MWTLFSVTKKLNATAKLKSKTVLVMYVTHCSYRSSTYVFFHIFRPNSFVRGICWVEGSKDESEKWIKQCVKHCFW
jgi:hypothetical protein